MLSAMAVPPRGVGWGAHGRTERGRAANRRTDRASGDGDEDGVPAGGPVGGRWRLHGRLGVAGAVGGSNLDAMLPGRGGPLVDPLAPRVRGVLDGQPGLPPRTLVDPDLHPFDPLVLGPGNPGHGHGPGC